MPRSATASPSNRRRGWPWRLARPRSRGQGVAEFALILPVLILCLLIVIDFGRLFMSYVTLTNVTRIAANYGATDPKSFTGTPNTATYDSVVSRETAGLNCTLRTDGTGHNPPIPTYPNGTALGNMSVATMTCDFSLVTPLLNRFFGGALPITTSAQFPIRTGAIANIGGSTTIPPPGSPVADFTFSGVTGGTINGSGDVTGTAPVTVNVIDSSANAQTWEWDWGDGSAHEFSPTPLQHQYNPSVDTTYVVSLKVTNTIGMSIRSRSVTVGAVSAPPPVADFYGTPVANPPNYTSGGGSGGAAIFGSLPLTVNFTNTSTTGTAFSWDFGDGSAPSTATAPQNQYSSLGIFTVTLTITAPSGATPSIRSNYITVGCVVPNFANTLTSAAGATWSSAHFTGSIRYRASGNNGNGSINPPNGSHTIVSQTIAGGTFVTPTKQGGQPYKCGDNIIVDYT